MSLTEWADQFGQLDMLPVLSSAIGNEEQKATRDGTQGDAEGGGENEEGRGPEAAVGGGAGEGWDWGGGGAPDDSVLFVEELRVRAFGKTEGMFGRSRRCLVGSVGDFGDEVVVGGGFVVVVASAVAGVFAFCCCRWWRC